MPMNRRMLKRFPITFWASLLVTMLLSGGVNGEAIVESQAATTRPAGDAATWAQTVERLAECSRGKDFGAIAALLKRGPIIRTFASETLQPPERLLGGTTGATLLGVHAYEKMPATLASDLAEDFRNSRDVTDELRRDMIPPDEAAERRANDTAAQWLHQILKPEKNQPVAVIVLWRPDRRDNLTSTQTRPIFILAKGERVEGEYVFRHVVFGDPLDAKN